MKLRFNGVETYLSSDSSLEEKILVEPSTGSKLAFKINKDAGYNFDFEIQHGEFPSLDWGAKRCNVLFEQGGFTTYLLRMMIDAVHVSRGNLPLHSAAIQVLGRTLFVVGDTNSGKSSIAHSLKENYNGCIIGDDHIIVSEQNIVGNSWLRIRNKEGQQTYEFNDRCVTEFDDYSLLFVDINQDTMYNQLSKMDVISRPDLLLPVLKYIIKDVKINERLVSIAEIVGDNIIQDYIHSFQEFIFGAEYIAIVKGSLDYTTHKIVDEAQKAGGRK